MVLLHSRSLFLRYLATINTRNMVVFTQKINGVTGDSEWDAMDDNYDFHQEITRSAFADMLHDTERNKKYYEALKIAIDTMHKRGKPANVLDIGTGTGLLSMMAARCNADSIVACEAFKPMGDCAVEIIKANGYADKIKVIPKRSTELTVGQDGDLKFKPNILVTEVFDTELIGEGAIETFSHAHSNLLEEDCIVVPESAKMYAQVIESADVQKWNKLMNIIDGDNTILKIPSEIQECPGSAAVHDIQLSQLPVSDFKMLSDPIVVFEFDWSGKIPLIKNETNMKKTLASASGNAQMVFVWWDLKMDINGDILLSCAPWWNHPDTDHSVKNEFPQDKIPWRDHWMQAVYYIPNNIPVNKNEEMFLTACHDEYSLWFNLETKNHKPRQLQYRPTCNCGIHMTYSRTHIAYMNDEIKNKKFINALKNCVNEESIVLCLNGASTMGLIAAKLGAKKVLYIESGIIAKKIIQNIVDFNGLSNISIVEDVESLSKDSLKQVSLVLSDPHFNSAILPWDNLRHGYYISKLNLLSNSLLKVMPVSCSVWAMSVEFLDLNKIKAPLGICENINLEIFDNLIKNSRSKCDEVIEPQPLWEYPCICKSKPIKIVNIDFNKLEDIAKTSKGSVEYEIEGLFNGFVFWLTWNLDDNPSNIINNGPLKIPALNKRVVWDPHIRQGVKILERNENQRIGDEIKYTFVYNLQDGMIKMDIGINSK